MGSIIEYNICVTKIVDIRRKIASTKPAVIRSVKKNKFKIAGFSIILSIILLLSPIFKGAAASTPFSLSRISVTSGVGGNADSDSYRTASSDDGRYILYKSGATNLVAGDTNSRVDMFVYDSQAGTNEIVSKATDGTLGNDTSNQGAISADGRYVVYDSDATNLVSGYTGAGHVYVRDRQSNTTEIVSISDAAVEGNASSSKPSISNDGRYVTFHSNATNLVAGDTNGVSDIFVYDRNTDTIERVSVDNVGTEANNDSLAPSISGDGRYVSFESEASNLVASDSNNHFDIFVYDRNTDTIERVSVDNVGTEANATSTNPSISSDGRYVAFRSEATNLVTGDTNAVRDIFIYDRDTDVVERVSIDDSGTQANAQSDMDGNTNLSDDGRFITFYSDATNLVAGDTNAVSDVFLYDRTLDKVRRVSTNLEGYQGNGASYNLSISPNGKQVFFKSSATNFVIGDTEGFADIFKAQVYGEVSGTIYDTDGSTPLSSSPTIKLSVGNSVYTTTADGSGVYNFSNITSINRGDVVTIWTDGGSDRATLVFTYGGICTAYPNCTGLSLVKNQVILFSKNTAIIDNGDLSACDDDSGANCSDNDIGFTSNSNTLTLSWPTNELKIATSTVFTPAGNIFAQKLEIAGVYKADNESINLSGSGDSNSCTSSSQMPICLVSGGEFVSLNETINLTSNANTSIPNGITYYNLGLGSSPDASQVNYSLFGNTTVTNSLKVGDNSSTAFDTFILGSNTLTLSGNSSTTLNITNWGIFNSNSSNVIYSGNISKVASTTYNNLTLGSGSSNYVVNQEAKEIEGVLYGAIDEKNGFVYYVPDPDVREINLLKVSIPDNQIVSYIKLNKDEYDMRSIVVDSKNGFLYLGDSASTTGFILKIDTKTMKRVGILTLNSGENNLDSAAIDEDDGFAYFVTQTSTTKVVKINLADFTRVGSIDLNVGEGFVRDITIDTTRDKLYISQASSLASNSKLIKINLQTFTRESDVTLSGSELGAAVVSIDTVNNFAYMGSYQRPDLAWLAKVNASTMTRVGSISTTTKRYFKSIVIDNNDNLLYLNARGPSGSSDIFKVNMNTFTFVATTTYPTGTNVCCGASIGFMDKVNKKFYLANDSYPTSIFKFDLPSMSFDSYETVKYMSGGYSRVIDNKRGYIYYMSNVLNKYRLRDDKFETQIALDSGDGSSFNDIDLDEENGFAYITSSSNPAKIIKVDIVNNVRVATITLNSGETSPGSTLDPVGGILYVGTNTAPGKIIKIDLSSFTRTDTLTLTSGSNYVSNLLLNPLTRKIYSGIYTSPGKVIELDIDTFTVTASTTLPAGESWLWSGAIDPEDGYVYFTTDDSPVRVIKVNTSTMQGVSSFILINSYHNIGPNRFAIDKVNDLAYAAVNSTPGDVYKIDLQSMMSLGTTTGLGRCVNFYDCDEYMQGVIYDENTGYLYVSDNWVVKIKPSDISLLGATTSQAITVNGNVSVLGDVNANIYNPTLNFLGDLTINSGKKFKSTTGSLNLSGNLTNNGTFTHASGTVNIAGSGTTSILGNPITFNNFTSSSAGKTIQFDAGVLYTLAGTFSLTGSSGNNIILKSDTNSVDWTANFNTAQTSQYLTVNDSGCNGGSSNLTITSGTDGGTNDPCFVFSLNNNPDSPTSLGSAGLVNGSTDSDTTPTFNFTLSDSDVSDTVKYKIQIDNNSDFSSPTVDYSSALGVQGAKTFTVGQVAGGGTYITGSSGQTLSDGSYYWRVKTIDNGLSESAYSTANSGSVAFIISTSGSTPIVSSPPPANGPPLPNPVSPTVTTPSANPPTNPIVVVTPPSVQSNSTVSNSPITQTQTRTTPNSSSSSGSGSGGLPPCPATNEDLTYFVPNQASKFADNKLQLANVITSFSINNGDSIKEINRIFKEAMYLARDTRRATINNTSKKSLDHNEVIKQANNDYKIARKQAIEARKNAKKALKNPKIETTTTTSSSSTSTPLTVSSNGASSGTTTNTNINTETSATVISDTQTASLPTTTDNTTSSQSISLLSQTPVVVISTTTSTNSLGQPCVKVIRTVVTPATLPNATTSSTVNTSAQNVENPPLATTGTQDSIDSSNDSRGVRLLSGVYDLLSRTFDNLAVAYLSFVPPDMDFISPGFAEFIRRPIVQAIGIVSIIVPFVISSALLTNVVSTGASVVNIFVYFLTLIQQLLRFKRTPKPWGTAYDSVTKRPLPFTRIEILNQNSRKLESVITDNQGRYGFIISNKLKKGEAFSVSFKAYQNDYNFPSQQSPLEEERVLYPNIYLGGLVTVAEGGLNYDIPMDPHPQILSKLVNIPYSGIVSVKLNNILTVVSNALFILGLVFGILNFLVNPGYLSVVYLLLVLLTHMFRISGIKLKPYGLIKDVTSEKTVPFGFVALYNLANERVNFAVSDNKGRYFILTKKGKYILRAFTPSYISPMRQSSMAVNSNRGWITSEIEL